MIQLQLQPEIEAQLAAEANARGVDLPIYLESLLNQSTAAPINRDTASQAVDRIRELRKGNVLGGLSIKKLVDEGRKY